MRRLVVPVDLGGPRHRCATAPPPRPAPEPETVEALIHHYDQERRRSGTDRLEVAFFHGGLPGPALLDAVCGRPLRVATTPADLSPDDLPRLREVGVETLELAILTFEPAVLRACNRGYRSSEAGAVIRAAKKSGFRVGVTLSPGLPGSSHAAGLADATRLGSELDLRPDFVRVLPALAFAGSQLATWAAEGRWRPMNLGEAVSTVSEMVDHLEDAEISVARVGLQVGPDIVGEVHAGPVHPNLRGLVEARRFQRRLLELLSGRARGSRVVVAVNPADLAWVKGVANENLRAVRAELGFAAVHLAPDAAVPRGSVRLARQIA